MFLSFIFSFLQKIYFFLTTTERLFFKLFYFLVYKPKATVISIGNLSMGGTGKTPILFELLDSLHSAKVAVISRGYKSPWERSFYLLRGNRKHPKQLTDEALLFNRKFPNIPIFLGKNRHHSAIMSEKLSDYKYILLDDGFQYRRLRKDINILLWDSTTSLKNAQLLPNGVLREPLERLKEASVILLTRCEMSSQRDIKFWKNWLTQKTEGKPIIEIETVFDCFVDAKNQVCNIRQNCLAFAAIGNPESFFKQLSKIGFNLNRTITFKDHHRFSEQELENLVTQASSQSLQLVCTEKDLIKIPVQFALQHNIVAMKIRLVPKSKTSLLDELQKVNIFITR